MMTLWRPFTVCMLLVQGPSIYYPDVAVEAGRKHGANVPVIIGAGPTYGCACCLLEICACGEVC